jgi:hypothetical protein
MSSLHLATGRREDPERGDRQPEGEDHDGHQLGAAHVAGQLGALMLGARPADT